MPIELQLRERSIEVEDILDENSALPIPTLKQYSIQNSIIICNNSYSYISDSLNCTKIISQSGSSIELNLEIKPT